MSSLPSLALRLPPVIRCRAPPHCKPWLVTRPLRLPGPRCGLRLMLTMLGNGAPGRCDLAVACGDLRVIAVVYRDRLGQGEQLLFAPLPVQRLGDGRFVVLTAIMAELRHLPRIAVPAQDGTDNRPPRHAGDVADPWCRLRFLWVSAFCRCWMCWLAEVNSRPRCRT